MLNEQRLTGIGTLHFMGANQLLLNDEFAGLSVMYKVVHGEEDKKDALNPKTQQDIELNFNDIFNQ